MTFSEELHRLTTEAKAGKLKPAAAEKRLAALETKFNTALAAWQAAEPSVEAAKLLLDLERQQLAQSIGVFTNAETLRELIARFKDESAMTEFLRRAAGLRGGRLGAFAMATAPTAAERRAAFVGAVGRCRAAIQTGADEDFTELGAALGVVDDVKEEITK